MGRRRYVAALGALTVLVGLAPATAAHAAGQYGDVRPSAILRSIGGGATYQRQGQATAVSADGKIAVVAGGESMPRGGDWTAHVYIWVRTAGAWHRQAVLSPPPTDPPSRDFGIAVSLSPDGRYLAVGDDLVEAVYVYEHTAAGWTRSAPISAPGAGGGQFGQAVAINGDGSALIVGAPYGGFNTTAGAAWAFDRTAHGWGPAQPLIVPNGLDMERFGSQVAISADGRHAALTNQFGDVQGEDAAGDVVTFDRSGPGTWTAGAVVGDQTPTKNGEFGSSIAMSSDGSTLVVGSAYVYGDLRARVAVFRRDTGTWVRSAQFFGYYSSHYGYFGWSVAVSADGDVVAVGVPFRNSATSVSSGAVQRYQRTGTSWSYLGATYVKGAGAYEYDGWSVALAGNTDQLFIGAPGYGRTDDAHTGAVLVIG